MSSPVLSPNTTGKSVKQKKANQNALHTILSLSVTLCSRHNNYCQPHTTPRNPCQYGQGQEHFSEICSSIQTATFSALKNVFKVMRFEDIQVEPAFLCPCKCSPSHAATVCHFLYGGSYTVCTKTGISIGCLQKEQQFWFQEKKGETRSVQGFIEFM